MKKKILSVLFLVLLGVATVVSAGDFRMGSHTEDTCTKMER
jgi:hypothetical protein